MLDAIEWETCWLEPRRDAALERALRDEHGMVPPSVAYFSASPWLARSMLAFEMVERRHVSTHLADLVGLVVAEDNSCRYCYAMQRTMMRLQGFRSARIRELEASRFAGALPPEEVAALELARRVSRGDPRAAAEGARLHALGWSADAVAELAFLAAVHLYLNRIATLPALPVARVERVSRLPGLGLAAPLARRFFRPRARRLPPLAPAECAGPWAYLVEALARLPAGRALRRVLDDACASPVLPRRTKLLVFAVVARTLGAAASEREAARLLEECGVPAETLASTLRHLHAPELDAVDAAVVPFARETVRYRPAEVQRQARALLPLLGPEKLVELVGTAALANAVCRLGAAA